MDELARYESYAPVKVHAKTWLVVSACNAAYFAQLFALVGSGFLANDVEKYFGTTHGGVWLSSGITIFTVVLGPPTSQIADLFGRKWILVAGLILGAVGAIVAATADSMGTVIAGFIILGLCYSVQPLILAVVSEVLPRKQRPMAQAVANTTAGIGAFVGLAIGGALLKNEVLSNYRIYMYIVTGVFAAAALAVAVGYNTPPRESETALTTAQKVKSLDWIGYLLFTPGLVLFCVGLFWSKNPYPWTNARVLGTFITGVVLIVAFVLYEIFLKKDGLLHHRLFKHGRNFPIALLVIFAEGLGFFAANEYYVFEITILTGKDLLVCAMHYGVTFLVASVFALIAGIWSKKMKAIRIPMVAGFTLILIFFICMATTTTSTSDAALWVFGAILGAGTGIILPIDMVAAQFATPPDMIAEASALILAIRSLGGAIGLAINNAIFTSTLGAQLPRRIAKAALPLGLPPRSLGLLIQALAADDKAALAQIPGITPRIIGAAAGALVEAYTVSFRYCWVASACFIAVAVIASVFFYDPKEDFNAHIDAPAEKSLIEEQEVLEHERGIGAKQTHEHVEAAEKA